MTKVVDPDENITTFEYDALGREKKRSLANGNQITRSYDEDGNLAQISNQGSESIFSSYAYEYDALGNRVEQIEEDGSTSTYSYDALSRLLEVTYPKEKIESLTQEPDTPEEGRNEGNKESTDDSTKTKDNTKDNNGKKSEKSLVEIQAFSITAAKNEDKGNSKGGNKENKVTEGKKRDDEKKEKGNGNGNDTSNNKSENKTTNCPPSSNEEQNGLNLVMPIDDQPDYLIKPYDKVSYTYDAVGNRLSMTTDEEVTHYEYNSINQLLTAGELSFNYDENGNVISRTSEGETTKYSYNGLNRLINIDFEDGSYANYMYDGLGRKVFREAMSWKDYDGKGDEKGNGNAYGKNKEDNKGQQKKEENASKNKGKSQGKSNKDCTPVLTGKGNGNSPLDNPGQGNKYGLYKKLDENPELKEQMDVTETAYLYQGFSTNIHKEYSKSGSPYAEYYRGANNQVVSRKMFGYHGLSNPSHDPNLKTTGGMLYYQYDGLNTVSSVTDRHGDTIENYRYDVFGGIQTGITAPYNTFAYTSQRYDDKAELVDMNARWYDPSVGRFLTQDSYRGDPMNPLTLNRYSYVHNNPVNMWDPTGNVAVEAGRYNSAQAENTRILSVISETGAFGYSGVPIEVLRGETFDNAPSTLPTDKEIFTYQRYIPQGYSSFVEDNSVTFLDKYKYDENNFYYQFEGNYHEEWDYTEENQRVKIIDGMAVNAGTVTGSTETFTRDSVLYWEIKVPASLAYEDHQEKIIANYAKAPSNIANGDIQGYDQGATSAQEMLLSDQISSSSSNIIQQAMTPPKPEKKKQSWKTKLLNGLQTTLDIVGLVPGVGEVADGLNSAIYTARGDYVNASLSAAAMVPFIGWGATGAKFTSKGIKGIDQALDTSNAIRKNELIPRHNKPVAGDNIGINLRPKGTDKFLLGGPGYLQTFASKGIGNTGKFTQKTASPNFSQEGSFAGKTIGEVSNSLRSGAIKTSDVSVEYIMRDGNKLLLNTRSSLSLKRAGIPEANWTMVNRTGDSFLESMLTQRLMKNGLTNAGTDTLRITGNGRFMSNLK